MRVGTGTVDPGPGMGDASEEGEVLCSLPQAHKCAGYLFSLGAAPLQWFPVQLFLVGVRMQSTTEEPMIRPPTPTEEGGGAGHGKARGRGGGCGARASRGRGLEGNPGINLPPLPRGNLLPDLTAADVKTCRFHPDRAPFCPILRVGDVVKFAGQDFAKLAQTVRTKPLLP